MRNYLEKDIRKKQSKKMTENYKKDNNQADQNINIESNNSEIRNDNKFKEINTDLIQVNNARKVIDFILENNGNFFKNLCFKIIKL